MKFRIVQIERELEAYKEKYTVTLVSYSRDSDADLIREAYMSGKEVSINIVEPAKSIRDKARQLHKKMQEPKTKKKADKQELAILLDNIASNVSRVYGVSKKKILEPIPKNAGNSSLYAKIKGKKKAGKK